MAARLRVFLAMSSRNLVTEDHMAVVFSEALAEIRHRSPWFRCFGRPQDVRTECKQCIHDLVFRIVQRSMDLGTKSKRVRG
jgi:hypothetical protein